MKENIGFRQGLPDFLYGLNNTGFVIDVHNTDKKGVLAYTAQNLLRTDPARKVGGNIFDVKPNLFQVLCRFQNGLVLNGCRDDMPAVGADAVFLQAEKDHIIAFGSAAGKDDLIRLDAD